MKSRSKKLEARVDALPYDDPDDPLFISAIARSFGVLRYCAEQNGPASIKELVQATGLPQPTVWRICHTLIRLGYLQRVGEGRVTPALPLLALGYAASSGKSLVHLARPLMEELARKFNGAVSLSVRDGLQMVFLERVEGGQMIFSELRAGSRVSLASSASGWAQMAGASEAHRKELLKMVQARMPTEYQRVQQALGAALKAFREKGLVVNIGMLHPEVNAIGVPVGALEGAPVAALTFGGPRVQFSPDRLEDEIGPALKALAHSLSSVSHVNT